MSKTAAVAIRNHTFICAWNFQSLIDQASPSASDPKDVSKLNFSLRFKKILLDAVPTSCEVFGC